LADAAFGRFGDIALLMNNAAAFQGAIRFPIWMAGAALSM
jgi:hypothetical protein